VFDHISKHLEVRQKYFAVRRIFNSILGVWKCGQTRSFVFDILHPTPASLICFASRRPINAVRHACVTSRPITSSDVFFKLIMFLCFLWHFLNGRKSPTWVSPNTGPVKADKLFVWKHGSFLVTELSLIFFSSIFAWKIAFPHLARTPQNIITRKKF